MESSSYADSPGQPQANDLKIAENILRATLDSSMDMIQVFEAMRDDSGEIVDFKWILNNHASEKMYGNVIGQSLLQQQPGVVEEGIFEAFKQVVETGEPQQYEKHYVHEQFNGWLRQLVVKLNGGVATTTSDITSLKKTEQALRNAKENLKATLDSSTFFIQAFKAVRDEAGKIIDFRWTLTNNTWNQLYGDVIGKSLLEENPGVEETGLFNKFVQVTETGITIDHEQYYSHEQFEDQWFHQTLVKMGDGFVMNTEDITQKRKAESEILRLKDQVAQTATDKFESIFYAIDEGFCIYELIYNEKGKLVDLEWIDVNPAYERHTGLKDVVGKRHSDLLLSTEDYWYDIYEMVSNTGNSIRFEQWDEPTNRWYQTCSSRVGKAGSRQVAIVFQDITEQKHREEQQAYILRLNDALRFVSNPIEAQQVAMKQLGEHLKVDRVVYADINIELDYFQVADNYTSKSVQKITGQFPFAAFGPSGDKLKNGENLVINDVNAAITDDGERAAFKSLEVQAVVAVPLLKDGKLIADLSVHQARPRYWKEEEIALIQETAERTWAAVERARAEEALRKSQKRFQSIANLIPDLLWDSEPDGLTGWYNQRWLEYTGQTLDEASGWGWVEAIHPDDREASAKHYGKAVETGMPLQQEHRIRRHDGVYRWFVVSVSPVKDETGRVIKMYGAATEIEDRRVSEEALRKSEEKYRMLFETMSQGYQENEVIRDENGNAVDHRLLSANPQFERLTGMKLSDCVGKPVKEIMPDTDSHWLELFDRVVRTGIPEHCERKYVSMGRWYDVDAFPIGGDKVGVLMEDISERKNQERNRAYLLELSDALRLLSDPIGVGDEALRLLRKELNAPRAIYAEALDQKGAMRVAAESLDDELFPMKGSIMHFSDIMPKAFLEALHGKPIWCEDIQRDNHLLEQQAGFAALKTGAWLMVPLVKEGKLVAEVTIHHSEPRVWKSQEIQLVQDTIDRAWLAVQRARAEQQVRDSEKRLRIATEAADMATWEWDLTRNLVIWNERHFQIFGLEPQDNPVDAMVFFKHIHPVDQERVDGLLRKSLAEDVEFDTEFRAVLEDGSERWMSGYGRVMERLDNKPISMSGVMFDITARRQVENDLHRIEERQKAIIESAKDYAILTLDLELRVRDWNAGAQNMMGYLEEEILGQPGEIFFVPEDRIKGAPQAEKEKAIKEGRAKNERWHLRKDGSRFYGSGITTPLLDETGNIIGLLKVMRDLTHEKRSEDALKKASKRKDEFLAMLAHELRNPISTVTNGISILKIMQQANPQVSEIVGMMDNQVTHLVRMIDDLLDVSRVTQGKIELKSERLEIATLVQNAVKAIQQQYESRGKMLHINKLTPGLFIQGDPTRLSQVITNLLTNSLRYTGDDGQVWVHLVTKNNEAVIRVKDNGIGLSFEQQTSVFELFVQADNSLARTQGGLGIGLTLVRQLVEMHGGRVEAKRPGIGQGSEFTVYLPLMDVPEQTTVGQPGGSVKHPSFRILLIDDLEDLAKLTATLLRFKGYQVDVRFNGIAGAEAVELLKPAAVFCDIGMPDLDGYQTAGLIRQGAWGRNVTLIALSGYGQEEDKQRSKEAGFDGHLIKPIDIEELKKMINDLAGND